jgi:FkbM family methyltransferase
MLQVLKRMVETLLGCRIYRSSLPRGVDLFYDLERDIGRAEFRTVFDVGANVGQSALAYARAFPNARIVCFEPVAPAYAELLKNTARLPQIRCFEMGLGASEGPAQIHVGTDSRVSSIPNRRPGDTAQPIRLATLAGFCRAHDIGQIDLLKIDTEGFELPVLRGATALLSSGAVRFIQAECAPARQSGYFVAYDELTEYLRGFGYELYGVYEQTPHWTGRKSLLYFNLVFVSPRLLHEPGFIASMNAAPEALP